jgi:hypothetical protein
MRWMQIHPYKEGHRLVGGRLEVHGQAKFLKTGKPLRNYGDPGEVNQLMRDLPIIAGKGYDNLAINCYWHHFNPSGDGRIEVSLDPLRQLLEAVREHGMYASLSVETYGVGGGQIPAGFWERHPEAVAVNHEGHAVRDTEYGYNTAVPSLFSRAYLEASRHYMRNLVAGLGAEHFLYFETTVEPQFMGGQWLDYSEMARSAYESWAKQHEELEPLPFPDAFPIGPAFVESRAWNCFRARQLAEWIDGDALALKAGAGGKALWIATDYLDAEEPTMMRRLGDPIELLQRLRHVNILQVNWSWCNIERRPNRKAYERVHQAIREHGKEWAVTEHMTINGTDYFPEDIEGLLLNTLANGTRFGWEFVDIGPDTDDPTTKPNQVLPGDFKPQHFCLYDAEWNPKPTMALIESDWDRWMKLTEGSQIQSN